MAYGSDAFGGVIAARTLGVAPGAPMRVAATGDYGVGIPGGRVGATVSAPIGEDGGFLVSGHYRSYGNWDSPEGEVINSGFRDSGVLLRGVYRPWAPGLFTAGWQGDYGRDIDRPRNNSASSGSSTPRRTRAGSPSLRAQPVAGFSRVGVSAFIGSLRRHHGPVSLRDGIDRRLPRAGRRERQRLPGPRALPNGSSGPCASRSAWTSTAAIGLHALDISARYTDPPAGERERLGRRRAPDRRRRLPDGRGAGPAAADVVGRRARRRRDDAQRGRLLRRPSTSNTAASGFVALTAGSFGGFSASGQFSHGFRDPVLSDRYFRGPSGRGFITGNPDLEPETSDQFDVALRYSWSGIRTAFYLYEYRIKNLIERYPGTLPDDFFFRNRGEAKLRGLELEVQADLPGGFALALAAQIERGETVDDDAPLDDIPPESFTLQLRKAFGPAFVQARGAVYAGDPRPGPTERARPGYGLLDLGGGYKLGEIVEFQVYVRNVLDKAYLITVDARSTLAPGISAAFTTFVRF